MRCAAGDPLVAGYHAVRQPVQPVHVGEGASGGIAVARLIVQQESQCRFLRPMATLGPWLKWSKLTVGSGERRWMSCSSQSAVCSNTSAANRYGDSHHVVG